MSRPVTTTVTIGNAVANGIATSQSLGAAGNLTLNGSLVSGGVATMDAPRRVIITSAGNDSGITWTITGAARPELGNGKVITETIQGANAGIAQSTQDFATVTNITGSGATAGNVTAGTNGTASGPWVPWDEYVSPQAISCAGFVLSGTPTWQVDYTYDDVFGTWLPPGVPFPRAFTHQSLQGETGNADGSFSANQTIRASRLTLVAVGSVELVQNQSGM